MEFVFHKSNCTVACQIKFATCTLQGNALTWWNSHVKKVSHEVAYGMTWKALKKMLTDKYSPRGKIKKLEIELWNLKVKGTDISKITRKPSKTGKHGREERKSTKEARDAKPKAGKVKKSKLWSTLGQFSVNKSQP
ncbi:reverse transcriptase domain-containing protein [Tanacetum coccineum]|uniref:Reverse transcriptase domain-containing protein n=1 Tax=Tanacetum coccineum TaxID=301880 RepID=A0ABQ5IWT4_9ASTR